MKESVYTAYENLPLFLNAETVMHFSLSKAHVFFKTCEQSERYLLHSDSSTILYILYFSF